MSHLETPIFTVVVAGGSGRRFGSMKQYESLDSTGGLNRVLDHSVRTALECSDGVVLVVPADDVEHERTNSWPASTGVVVVAGGPTRTASTRCGLAAVPADAGVILVHDAARPFASPDLFRSVIDAVRAGVDGAIPGLPVTDTVKTISVVETTSIPSLANAVDRPAVTPLVVATPDRATLVAVQTPQAFRAEVLLRAHQQEAEGSDDASLVEMVGGTVIVVPGEPDNRKITHPEDLVWARELVARRAAS